LENFKELDIELLLFLVKCCGKAMRSDDPASLKEIVSMVQNKATENGDSNYASGSRVKYMLSIIMDLKNNKINSDEDEAEMIDRLKKLIKKSFKNQSGNGGELKIEWKDLISNKSKGRWWLVGSAWAGMGEAQDTKLHEELQKAKEDMQFDNELMALAHKQRMNTDLRKSIFCILMSSEDYQDAYDKLMKLHLKKQEREVVYVLLHCCSKNNSTNFMSN